MREPDAIWLFMHRYAEPVLIMLNMLFGVLNLLESMLHPMYSYWYAVLNFSVVGFLAVMYDLGENNLGYIEWKRRTGK